MAKHCVAVHINALRCSVILCNAVHFNALKCIALLCKAISLHRDAVHRYGVTIGTTNRYPYRGTYA